MMTHQQSDLFDYGSLDTETRIVVQQRTTEVRETIRTLSGLVRQTAETVWALGEKLADVQQRLAPSGQFAVWCASELPGVSRGTIYNALNVHRAFPDLPTVGSEFEIPLKALYLLAAPSTPDEARQEAIERAAAGEVITHTTAHEIRRTHTPPVRPATGGQGVQEQREGRRIADLSDEERTALLKRLAAKRLRWIGAGPNYLLVARDSEVRDDGKEQHRLETLADAERVLKLPVTPAPPSRWARPESADGPHLPDDFQKVQEELGNRGTITMDARTGVFRLSIGDTQEEFHHEKWWAVQKRISLLFPEAAQAEPELPAIPTIGAIVAWRRRDGHAALYRLVEIQGTRVGLRRYPPAGLPSETTVGGDLADIRLATDADIGELLQASVVHLPGWSFWRNDDGTFGAMHDCGIKLRNDDAEALVAEARTMKLWIERLAGWHVSLDVAGTGWQASHEHEGTVNAPDLPHLALAAWKATATAQELPDLPERVIDAAFLAGWVWQGERTGVQMYQLPGGLVLHFETLGELEYELGLPEQVLGTDAPPVGDPDVPDATAEMRADLAAWLTEHLRLLRPGAVRILAQTLVPASTQPWDDATEPLRAAIAQKLVAGLDEQMLTRSQSAMQRGG